MMNYYKIKYSKVYRDELTDEYICKVNFTPVVKLGKKNKSEAVDIYKAVVYSYCITMNNEASIIKPRYLASDKPSLEGVHEEFKVTSKHIESALRLYVAQKEEEINGKSHADDEF